MAKAKLCTASLDHDGDLLTCDEHANHYGPMHWDHEKGKGWGDPALPPPPVE